ncbi:hypothetical protein T310_8049, partial [Rasamsonia emersonii CBS 393.64]
AENERYCIPRTERLRAPHAGGTCSDRFFRLDMEPQACNVQDETLTRNNHDRVQDSKSSYLRCKNEIAWQMVDPFTSAGLAQAQRMSDDSQAVRPSSCHGATPPFLLSAPQEPVSQPLCLVGRYTRC